MPNAEIKSYQATIHAGTRTNRARATILLLDAKKNTIGLLGFVDPDTPVPPSSVSGPPQGYYPIALYPDLLDLLRNESPVYLEYDAQSNIHVTTSAEPVGDGDKAPARLTLPI